MAPLFRAVSAGFVQPQYLFHVASTQPCPKAQTVHCTHMQNQQMAQIAVRCLAETNTVQIQPVAPTSFPSSQLNGVLMGSQVLPETVLLPSLSPFVFVHLP